MFVLVRIPPKRGVSAAVLLNNPLWYVCLGLPDSPEDPDVELYFHHNFLDVGRCGPDASRPADFSSAASTDGPRPPPQEASCDGDRTDVESEVLSTGGRPPPGMSRSPRSSMLRLALPSGRHLFVLNSTVVNHNILQTVTLLIISLGFRHYSFSPQIKLIIK